MWMQGSGLALPQDVLLLAYRLFELKADGEGQRSLSAGTMGLKRVGHSLAAEVLQKEGNWRSGGLKKVLSVS